MWILTAGLRWGFRCRNPSGQEQAALQAKPTGEQLGLVYRWLGTTSFQKQDQASALKFFRLYLPFAPETEKVKVKQIVDRLAAAQQQ